MTKRSIKFGFNHMVSPSLTPDELVDAAVTLKAVAIELRNDVGANSLKDVETARRVGAKAADAGIEVAASTRSTRSTSGTTNAPARPRRSPTLAAAAGATGLVMCPLNEGKMLEDTPEKAAALRAALTAITPILAEHGLKGLSSRSGSRFRRCASSATRWRRSTPSAEPTSSRSFTTLSIIAARARAGFRQTHRARAYLRAGGPLDQLRRHARRPSRARRAEGSPRQRRTAPPALRRRLCRLVSFEPFAKEVHGLADPIAAVRDSMAYVRDALA